MSTVAHQAFSTSQSYSITRSGLVKTQTNINAPGENYTGDTWVDYSNQSIRVGLSNTSTQAGNQDKSLELKLTTSFTHLNTANLLPFSIGAYTTVDGETMPASTQRIAFSSVVFQTSTSGFGINTDYHTQQGNLVSYHEINGSRTLFDPSEPIGSQGTTLSASGLNFEYNPSTGTDTLSTGFDFRVKHTVEENTTNNSFVAYTQITPILQGTLTNYWLGDRFVFDGINGDDIAPLEGESSVVCTASVKKGFGLSYAFTTPSTFDPVARNFVAFPQEGVPSIYIEDGYVASPGPYIAVDYVASGYFEAAAEYFEEGPAFDVSGLMTQSFAGEFTMPPTLLGQLISIEADLEADTQLTGAPILARPASALISGASLADFSAGRIRPGDTSIQSATEMVASSGRLQQIASDLVAATQMPPTHPFLLKGGEGIVAGASQVTTEGGYLQTLGTVNFNGESAVTTGSNTTANLGIILKGFEVDADSISSVASLGGLALPGIAQLSSDFATEIVPGYLWSGEGLFTSTSQIDSITSLLFNTPQSFMTMTSTIEQPFLAGFRLLGEADLLSNGGTLAAGKLWIIDDFRRLTVQPETRLVRAPAELREIYTVQETRLNTVEQELSLAKVKQETRQYKLPIAPIVFVSPTRTERI